MNFCSECGAPVARKIPPGDNLPRFVCTQCETVHYVNPKIIVGTIAHRDGSILMCRRAIEPCYGKWTLPAGFMELHETTTEGALRETTEEAGAKVSLQGLFSVIDVPHVSQTHLIYRATLESLVFEPGEETLEVRMMTEAEIPWNEIAFHSVTLTLQYFFKDYSAGSFSVHVDKVDEG